METKPMDINKIHGGDQRTSGSDWKCLPVMSSGVLRRREAPHTSESLPENSERHIWLFFLQTGSASQKPPEGLLSGPEASAQNTSQT